LQISEYHVLYARAIGSLMYAMVYTKPDIAHAVGVLSRHMSKLEKEHWTTIKRVFKYLQGTSVMQYAIKEDLDLIERLIYRALLMQNGLEI
jgi:hypothetical protein